MKKFSYIESPGPGFSKPWAGPKALSGQPYRPGLAWPIWTLLGLAYGFRLELANHYFFMCLDSFGNFWDIEEQQRGELACSTLHNGVVLRFFCLF